MKKILSASLCLLLLATAMGTFFAEAEATDITRGGTLTAAYTNKFSTYCPPKTTSRQGDLGLFMQVYEPLIRSDESGNLHPALALSWESTNDGRTITMKLRDDVTFHDGTKFNAEAVKYVMDWYKTPDLNPIFAADIAELESVDVLEEYVVRFNLSAPSSTFLSALAEYSSLMISPAAIETYGVDGLSTGVMCGTGPFILKEAVEGDHVTLVRNENYYLLGEDGQPLPYLDEVVIKIIGDDTVKATNLLSGDVQLVHTLTATSQYMLAKAPNVELFNTPSARVYNMMFNMRLDKWTDEVRQAFSHAINKQEILDAVCKDIGYLTPFFVGNTQWFYSDYEPYPFDVELAQKKLAEAGYPNGEGLTVTICANNVYNKGVEMGEMIKQYLEDLGITVDLQIVERAVWKAARTGLTPEEFNRDYGWDMFIMGSGGNANANTLLYRIAHTADNNLNNYGFYSNERVDELLDAAYQEMDVEKRDAMYEEIAQIMFYDDPFGVYINLRTNTYVVDPGMEDFRVIPYNCIILKDIRCAV